MCNNCYHTSGRYKKAWKCKHVHKSHYALGLCQSCYQIKYMSKVKKTTEDNNININCNNLTSDNFLEESKQLISPNKEKDI